MTNFDSHWGENLVDEIPGTKKVEAQRFLQPLYEYQRSYSPGLVLDAGCGDGVHIEVIATNPVSLEAYSFIGLDISMPALLASRKRGQPKWDYVQGDVGKLLFRESYFNIVFSYGVLAYTDDPLNSFSELCRVTRKGGRIGVWLYPKLGGLGGAVFSLIRKACQLTGPIGCRLIADCIVPFLGFLPTSSKMSLANASWRQCREVVLVNIAPRQLYFPEQFEVENWFKKNNIKIINCDGKVPITLWGDKC